MSKFRIRHITKYNYEVPVRDSASQIMLYPIQDNFQEVTDHVLIISGNPVVYVYQDYYGNQIGTFTHSQPHKQLIVDSRIQITTTPKDLPLNTAPAIEQWEALSKLKLEIEFIDFFKQEKFDAIQDAQKLIDAYRRLNNSTPLEFAVHFCKYVYENFKYKKGITTVESTVDEIWELKSGVCQDFAHILLVILRLNGIPSRYVSGYVCPNKKGMRGEGATHAWVEVFIPFYGWLGLDPTNNCIVNDTYVRLAVGKNFSDCSPVKGTYRGTSDHSLEVIVSVGYEDNSVSKDVAEHIHVEPIDAYSRNSFRKFQEMQQMQQ